MERNAQNKIIVHCKQYRELDKPQKTSFDLLACKINAFLCVFNDITFVNSNANATSLNEFVDEYNGTSCWPTEIMSFVAL